MFIVKDSRENFLVEDDNEEVKPSCEVRGGNLFVQLHFKALKDVPESAELINTVVTSNEEGSAEFAGCGKHLIAVRSKDEDDPVSRKGAFDCVKKYLSTMFGQDIGNSFKDEDLHTIDEAGHEMDAETLKKWEEQQQKKKDNGDEGEKETVDESIPSFGRFMFEDGGDKVNSADDEADEAGDFDEGDPGGDDDDEEGAGDFGEGDPGGDDDEADEAGDFDEGDPAEEEELPPPATYVTCYLIKAEGQPEKDHTDPKEVKKLDPKGKLKLPGNFNLGIEFQSGGATVDTIDMKKAAKGFMGKVNSEEMERQIRTIMRANFPTINIPDIAIRDNKTVGVELDRKTKKQGDAKPELSPEGYNAKLKSALANSEYSFWIQVNDYREKPFVHEKDVADVINAAVKKVGGWWAKKLSGVKPSDVFMLHGLSKMNKEETAQDEARRSIPNPSEIKTIIDNPKNNSSQIAAQIDKKFDSLIKKNNKASDNVAASAIKKWNVFKSANKDKFDTLDKKTFKDFYDDYKQFYNKTVMPMLSETFLSEQSLMREIFGIIYEDDAGDEKAEKDTDTSEDSGGDSEFEDDGDDEGDDTESSGGSSDNKTNDSDDEISNLFIVPMKGLDVDMDKSSAW